MLCAGIMLAALAASCKSDIEKVQELSDAEKVPSWRVKGLDGKMTEVGQMKVKFVTPLLLKYDFAAEKYTDFPQGLEVYRYNDSLALEASILANKAIFFEYKDFCEATGNVRVRNLKGELLETEKLYWNTKEKRIYTDVWVKITNKDAIINGEGLNSDDNFTNYEVLKISNSYIYVDEKK
jgi:LPS export ABC transporter protein LptC